MLEALDSIDPSRCSWVGKTPKQGDFISENIAVHNKERLLSWLSHGLMLASRDHGGNTWVNVYLNSPIWHFCSLAKDRERIVSGLLVPSFDNVNRLYPLLLFKLSDHDHTWQDYGQQAFYELYLGLAEFFSESTAEPHPNGDTRRQISAYYRTAQTVGGFPYGFAAEQPSDANVVMSRWWVQSEDPEDIPEPRAFPLRDQPSIFSALFAQTPVPIQAEGSHHAGII